MERIKKMFYISTKQQQQPRKNKSDQTVVSHSKKKRFSMILLKSTIDPNHEQKKRPTSKYISKSTSFLQLQSFTNNNGTIKRSRSMFGQLALLNKPVVGTKDEVTTANNSSLIAESVFQDYYKNGPESDILHTAAVSISSAYNTVKNNDILTLCGNHNNYLQLGIQFYEKGELENATHYWRLATKENEIVAIFFYGLALRHGWVKK
jgi:hypothetical protein